MADALQIDRLLRHSQKESMAYKGIDWLWSQDLQGGGYNNITQLQYDTQSVSNSGQFIVWSQAFLSVPYTMSATNIGATGSVATSGVAGALCFKAGYWNLVDSLQISCQNRTVNNLSNKSNVAQNIRVLIDADLNKGKTSLPAYGWTLDTPECNTLGGTTPNFYTQNNRISGQVNPPATGAWSSLSSSTNFGLLERVKLQNYQPDGVVANQNNINQLYRGQTYYSPANGGTQTTTGIAIIPLKYLSDFFSEKTLGMPLHNLRMYLQLNVSQGSATYTVSGNTTTNSTFTYQTIPITLTDAGIQSITNAGNATSLITLNIGSYNGGTTPTRLYYPTIQLEASVLARLTFPLKKSVTYRDIQYFTLPNQAIGPFNWQISNAIPGLKRLFIVPMIAAAIQQTKAPSWANLLSSTPGTTDPYVSLSNISLQLNTRQQYSNNLLYDYEMYLEHINAQKLNGDTSDYIAGSQLGEFAWLTSYRYYVFDCSKCPSILNISSNTPINVQLLATNNTLLAMDLFCFAEVQTDVILESTPLTTYVQ